MIKLLTILLAAWAALRRLFRAPFTKPTAIRVAGKKVCCPLFFTDAEKHLTSTWDLLNKKPNHLQTLLAFLKAITRRGEVPATAFLLTPQHSPLWLRFPDVLNDAGIAAVEPVLQDLCKRGIALFGTLYVDDLDPRFWDIEKHALGWAMLNERLGQYFTGYILAIESTEQKPSISDQQHYIHTMRQAMPGREIYAAHLQWTVAWRSAATTPDNADLIFAEAPWQIDPQNRPNEGDNQGPDGLARWVEDMRKNGVDLNRIILHEFNVRPDSPIAEQQRDRGRALGARGVGG